jgi:hypothetical protein
MKSKTKKIILAVAVIGAVAAGGVAFTAANTVPATVAGYDNQVVSGATASDVHYDLSDDGTTIDAVEVTFSSTITGKHVQIGFNDGDLETPECVITGVAGSEVATCDANDEDVLLLTKLAVVVSN